MQKDAGFTIHPGTFAIALPGGGLSAADGESLLQQVLDSLFVAGIPDGVLLALHGSMIYEGEDDPEGLLLERIRERAGKEIPIVAALDMHGKLTPRFLHHVDGISVYKTAPHTDEAETGAVAARMLMEALKTGVRPVTQACFIPMMLAGEKSETDSEPMCTLLARAREWETHSGLTCASFLLGFPWADTPHAGVHALASGTDRDLCARAVRELAEHFWAARAAFHFTTEAHEAEKAVALALEYPASPVILSDSGDNPTAGAAQNMAWFAEYLETRNIGPALISAIADPEAFHNAAEAGERSRIRIALGTTEHGKQLPFLFECTVEDLCQCGRVNVAVLKGKSVTCLVADQRTDTLDLSLVNACGIDVADYRIVVVKCGYQGPEYRAAAARSMLAITPGDTNEILEALSFGRILRPMWPLDSSMPSDYGALMRLYPALMPQA